MLVEVIAAVLAFALAIATTFAALVGLSGVLGLSRVRRCGQCRRLNVASMSDPVRSCRHCRHSRMLYPLNGLHHPRVFTHGHSIDRPG